MLFFEAWSCLVLKPLLSGYFLFIPNLWLFSCLLDVSFYAGLRELGLTSSSSYPRTSRAPTKVHNRQVVHRTPGIKSYSNLLMIEIDEPDKLDIRKRETTRADALPLPETLTKRGACIRLPRHSSTIRYPGLVFVSVRAHVS